MIMPKLIIDKLWQIKSLGEEYVRQINKWHMTVTGWSMVAGITDRWIIGTLGWIRFGAQIHACTPGSFRAVLSSESSGLSMGRYCVQVEGPDPLQLRRNARKGAIENWQLNWMWHVPGADELRDWGGRTTRKKLGNTQDKYLEGRQRNRIGSRVKPQLRKDAWPRCDLNAL
jgi:hypothetical protein